MNFKKLNININLINKINKLGFENLTHIQETCIPEIIKGNDVVGQAETGSGNSRHS